MKKTMIYLFLLIYCIDLKSTQPYSYVDLFKSKVIDKLIIADGYKDFIKLINLDMLYSRNNLERKLYTDLLALFYNVDKFNKM